MESHSASASASARPAFRSSNILDILFLPRAEMERFILKTAMIFTGDHGGDSIG